MISQRRELCLRIGMFVIGMRPPIPEVEDQRWIEIVIANASTRPTLWTQSGPTLSVDWEGRQTFRDMAEQARFFAATILGMRSDEIVEAGGQEAEGPGLAGYKHHWLRS